jgi:hypothetical protein
VRVVRARAPLDVDLEDKLLYGLTPTRLAYFVVSLLAAFALWSSQWAPSPVRVAACLAVAGLGSVAAWGRWRGRAVDAWVADISLFVINTHRVALNKRWGKHSGRPSAPSSPTPVAAGPIAIVVAGRTPDAGAATVAVELAACFEAQGYAEDLWSVRPVQTGNAHPSSATSVLLSVAAVEGGRVLYLDRGTGPFVAGVIPDDEHVRQAEAFKSLVEVIVAR